MCAARSRGDRSPGRRGADQGRRGTQRPGLTYLVFAARANLAEVALGELAKRHADSRTVRTYGRDMVRDHRQQYRALEAVATAVGVTLPTRPSRDQRRLARAWSHLDGDPTVTQAAAASLPVLQEHYEHATMLLRDLGTC